MIQKIFETLGKIALHKRFLLFFLLSLLICTLCFSYFLLLKKTKLEELSLRLQNLYQYRNSSLEKRLFKKKFLSRYRTCDPLYLEKHLEPLRLLVEETEELSALLQHPAFFMRDDLQKRLHFLKSSSNHIASNRIAFREENLRTSRWIKEAEVSFLHPVEVNQGDLEKILSLIEGVIFQDPFPPMRPQLIIQKFEMKKKHKEEEKESFIIYLQLLKREFL